MLGRLTLGKIVLYLLLVLILASSCISPFDWRVVDDEVVTDCYGDLIPCTNSTYDIGSPTAYWDSLYVNSLYSSNLTDVVGATLIVSGNNSLNPNRADYQCNGIADDVQINAALAACPTTGGRVVLLEGNYNTTQNILVPIGNTLEGQGWNTIITANGTDVTQVIVANGNDAQIKNLKVIVAAGCGTAGARPNIIYSIGRSTIILDNLYLYGDVTVGSDLSVNRQNGILLNNVDGSHIRNCLVTNNQYYGISLTNDCDFTFVRGNLCYVNRDGISINGCTGIVMAANTCILNTESGIHLASSSENSVEVNLVSNNSRDGIYCLSSSENTFAGNVARDNTWNGIHFDSGLFNAITGNTITDNTLSGIYMNGSNSTTITSNISSTNGVHGILLSTSNYCTVTSNNCYDQTANHGIYIYRSSHCSVGSNNCSENNIDGINVTGDGTANSDYNALVGNVCTGNNDDGIEIAGGANANKNIVLGNQLLGNGGTPLVDGGVNTDAAHNIIA